MTAMKKQELLGRAAELLGQDELAGRLGISAGLLAAWMSGDATMPDGQLLKLAQVLARAAREDRRE
jgi:transcriptional regulator with XRE-family HTH domain